MFHDKQSSQQAVFMPRYETAFCLFTNLERKFHRKLLKVEGKLY